MKYHPHGDASIADALVQLGQEEPAHRYPGQLGSILTGDGSCRPDVLKPGSLIRPQSRF
ncbi:MAG: DNA gyrase subunit A [Flavobacteriaceae bacterium]|nr:DNA gyrase subunit A [Flavobacteriaceae bacterium]